MIQKEKAQPHLRLRFQYCGRGRQIAVIISARYQPNITSHGSSGRLTTCGSICTAAPRCITPPMLVYGRRSRRSVLNSCCVCPLSGAGFRCLRPLADHNVAAAFPGVVLKGGDVGLGITGTCGSQRFSQTHMARSSSHRRFAPWRTNRAELFRRSVAATSPSACNSNSCLSACGCVHFNSSIRRAMFFRDSSPYYSG